MSSISRKPHVLKGEKTLAVPRNFIFFDTETNQTIKEDKSIEQSLKLGWVCYYKRAYGRHKETTEWRYFTTEDMFWDFVFTHTEPKQKLWIIARNIVFDFTVCKGWDYLHKAGYKLKFFHNNGMSVIVTVTKGNRTIVFLDSMNWFSESLAATGERIGIPKLSINFDTCTIDELSTYCRNDVTIELENFRLFIKFLLDNSISRLCYTKASTAMSAYLFNHYHIPIYIHNNADAIKLERESYKGGRCECFYIGDLSNTKYYILDVNSLYPFVMTNNTYPVKYVKILHNISIKDLDSYCRQYSVVAKVFIDTDEPVYALKDKRTIFPIGKFVNTLTTPEIIYALQRNHITKVYSCVLYDESDIFTKYVYSMYKLRQHFRSLGIKEYETLAKYLLNSLYGKFGQKAEIWEKIGHCENEPDREEIIFRNNPRRVMRLRYLLGDIYELKKYQEAYNSFPAISAHVTAYARMYLWQLMNIAEAGNYFYCDTDSLIVNDDGLYNLSKYINPDDLGKLKLQEQGNKLIIRGLKDYTTDTKCVIKGISKHSTRIAADTYEQLSWPTFKGLLKSDNPNIYSVKTVIKHLSREYTKGTINNTGFTSPFIYSQTQDIL